MAEKVKEKKSKSVSVEVATLFVDFFENYGAMFEPKSRQVVIKKLAKIIDDNFVVKDK